MVTGQGVVRIAQMDDLVGHFCLETGEGSDERGKNAALRGGWESSAATEKTRVGSEGGGQILSPPQAQRTVCTRTTSSVEWHIFYNAGEKTANTAEVLAPTGNDELPRTPCIRSSVCPIDPPWRAGPVRCP